MEIFAARELVLTVPGKDPAPVRVLIGRPEQRPGEREDWSVPYEIHGPEPTDVQKRVSIGIDAVQALQLLLRVLPAHMERYRALGPLTLNDGPDDGLGTFEESVDARNRQVLATIAAPRAPGRSCSFCGKPEAESKLVAGPAANICASCTRLACGVLGIELSDI